MKVLAQFKTIPNYVDFCLPELKSLLAMHNLDWREVFKHEFLPNAEENSKKKQDQSSTTTLLTTDATFLAEQADDIEESKDQMYNSKQIEQKHYAYLLRRLAGRSTSKQDVMPAHPSEISHLSFLRFPFVYLEFPSLEIASSIISKSLLLDVYIEVISEASDYESLISNVNHDLLSIHNKPEEKISFEVDPYNSHLTRQDIIKRINLITDRLAMWGKIDLKTPSKKFWVMERHIDQFTRHTDSSVSSSLLDIFFGIEIGRSSSCSRNQHKENFFLKYELKNRVYLGPTSTDNILSFLMCNQGNVRAGSMVLDPFVGSGSLLIPPSHYNAICYGGDLDPRVLHGFGVGRINTKSQYFQANSKYCTEMEPKIMLNFEQYDFPKPTIIRMDCVDTNLRALEVFDAIICDPPYGFRAMTRTANKNGKKKNRKSKTKTNNSNNNTGKESSDNEAENKDESNDVHAADNNQTLNEEGGGSAAQQQFEGPAGVNHDDTAETAAESASLCKSDDEDEDDAEMAKIKAEWPGRLCTTEIVSVDQIVRGLIGLADRILVPNGRLVFLYPIFKVGFTKADLSTQLLNFPNFNIIDISENTLSDKKSRLLITMEKITSNQSSSLISAGESLQVDQTVPESVNNDQLVEPKPVEQVFVAASAEKNVTNASVLG